jgi:hypothetical protein
MKILVKCPGCEGQGWFTSLPGMNPWTTGRQLGWVNAEEAMMECITCDGLGYVPKEEYRQLDMMMETGFEYLRLKRGRKDG